MKVYKFGLGLFTIILLVSLFAMAQGQPAGSSDAAALSLDEVIAKLQDNYEKIKTYDAEFEQEVWSRSSGKTVSQGSGLIKYKKPGKMVWHYQKPDEHIFINEGDTIWDYSPEDKEAYQLPVRDSVYKTFLLGMGDLKKDFEISFRSGRKLNSEGLYQLDLVPKRDNERNVLGTITFYVDPKSFLVRKTESVDALGNRNTIKFNNIRLNVELPDSLFKFTPPPGVKVIKPPQMAPPPKKDK